MLKVHSPQPQPTPPMTEPAETTMPPQPMPDEGGQNTNDMPPLPDGNQPDMGGNNCPDGEFDSDFDAGVDTNEEDNPKKYIQQLTGKLSQSLRSYNQTLGKPDEELCKFVAGMVVKQAAQGLTPDAISDIVDKMKSDATSDAEVDEEPNDDSRNMPMGESVMRTRHKRQIDEIFNDIISTDNTPSMETFDKGRMSYRKKPFSSPNFK